MELTYIVSLISLLGLVHGIQVGPVHLVDQKRYISYDSGPMPNNSLIECPIMLSTGEEIEKISWEFWHKEDKVGTYEWTPAGGGVADGLLYDVVKLDRTDGGLELTTLRYDLGGDYSCSATTTNQETDEAAKWEVVIIDMTSRLFSTSANFQGCQVDSTQSFPAVFPEPTVHSGLYSEDLGLFSEEIPSYEWKKFPYLNGSVAYSYENIILEVNARTPMNVYLMSTLGVTKADGTYIALSSIKSFDPIFTEPGCLPLKPEEFQAVHYLSDFTTCRGTYITGVEAKVECDKGYIPDGEISEVYFRCDEATLSWISEEEGLSVQSIQCVVDPDGGGVQAVSGNLVMVIGGLLLLLMLRW